MAIKISEEELALFNSEIRGCIIKKKSNIAIVARMLTERYGAKETQANLAKKIRTGSLRYIEAARVANVLGFKLEWIEK